MSKYAGRPVIVAKSAQEICDKFADLSLMSEQIAKLPEEQRKKAEAIQFGRDYITIQAPQVGNIRFVVTERSPERVIFTAQGTPMPMTIEVDLKAMGEAETEVVSAINIEIPAMVRAFVGPQIQKAADMMSDVIANIAKA